MGAWEPLPLLLSSAKCRGIETDVQATSAAWALRRLYGTCYLY